ncbi:hypothetical protein SAMN02799624_04371 [Paenibacillus sp. UNC496MF]|uniref:hypothetical protein n=1 Tax=Paenibacillus sp. UNC496MF TaxID=1502753 RepID=UPI0008E873EC|nr:hypothetical protein [Paenibacillus sp. UNC496MF]SFJ41207.1 hypothetical protein SAMN02799624_04371 [Paenibacillus sp. UNC496MF]
MRWLVMLMAVVLLAACGRSGGSDPEEAARKELAKQAVMAKMAHPKPVYRDELFELKLHIERTTVKAGEPIAASASLTYIGDQPKITVWGARSFLTFAIHDANGFAMEGASTAERAPTGLNRGQTYAYPFFKSGGYDSQAPDADFWRAFYAEKELRLPAGRYVLEANLSFDLHEALDGRAAYRAAAHATITVE